MSLKTIMQKLDEGRQYRNIDVSTFERRAEGDTEKTVSGYATTFNQPYELYRDAWNGYVYIIREQVDKDAFADTDLADVIMQYDHEGRVFARTSNNTLELDPDEHGLHIRANLGGTELGRQLFEEIEGGYTTKMSFGFRVGKDKREETEERDEETGITTVTVLRTILSISKLYDVSAVSLPANDATSISARKLCEGEIEQFREEILKREDQRKRIRIKAKLED
ncbi:MAG: HK97 family phage prohead protease [Oscillospiraceae bacterium]|nr:HK97 family phage prohead protease [Oscillospiraceae bacterium]MBQ2436719.1 HK97 family phage prohead protease [Clostridia bacterium]